MGRAQTGAPGEATVAKHGGTAAECGRVRQAVVAHPVGSWRPARNENSDRRRHRRACMPSSTANGYPAAESAESVHGRGSRGPGPGGQAPCGDLRPPGVSPLAMCSETSGAAHVQG